ncbi:MAG: LacI family DNA-binding transcriptional regulator [Candidatus Limiplasma sp.]|nr:LacI family DNA-binding transcriptional regulator [Candidatus Limiplasma sp.]
MPRPTIKTIAAAIGVAPNTVSLSLRDSPLVAPDTKRRVLEEAARQGYQRDALAQSLRYGRSHTIALAFGDVGNPLFAIRIKLLAQVFRGHGYQTFILNTDEDPATEQAALRTAVERKVDGVVLCPCQENREALALLHRCGVPCVLLGRQFDPPLEDAVVWDDREGGRLATQWLLERGCRRIAHLTASQDISSARLRLLGYEEALRQGGLTADPALIKQVSPLGNVKEALKGLPADCDGIFAFNDLLAWEAMALRPDLLFAGFDDIQARLRAPVKLTSIGADLEAEAREAAQALLRRIREPETPVNTAVLPVSLVQRSPGPAS